MRSLYFHSVISIFLSSFFLAYSEQWQSGCLPYFNIWCDLSANLECRSEMCCMQLAENTGCKHSPSAHHRTTMSGYIFAIKVHIDNQKNLLNSNISFTCPHNMMNFGPLTADIGWRASGTPANYNGFHILASLLHQRCSTEVNKPLQNVWPSTGLVHYI